MAVPLAAFFAAETLHGSGFLAAFVGGMVFGSAARSLGRGAFEFTEDAGTLLGHLTWIGFGAAAAPVALHCATVPTIAFALLALTVLRMLPVALSLIGSGFRWDTVLFLGWFGPRGLATVVFAAAAHGEEGLPNGEMLFGSAVWTVLLSVVLHGLSASPLAAAYARRCAERPGGENGAVPALPAARRPM